MIMGFYQQGVLLIVGIIAAASAQRILFLGSDVLRPGANYEATVTSLTPDGLAVTVSIVNNVTKQVVREQVQPVQGGSQESFSLPIPSTISSTDKYVVRVLEGGVNNVRYQNETELRVEKKSRSIFIVTDKAIYKPGALVKFRVFVLDVTLRPRTEPISVEIFDPKGNKIRQWLNQNGEPGVGVFSESVQLSYPAILGDWKIMATSEMESQDLIFKVDEYVLPKFEVTVSLDPTFIVISENSPMSMTIHLSAEYTIGQPVEGDFTVEVGPQRTWYNVKAQKFVGEISGVRSIQVTFPAGAFRQCTTCGMMVEASVTDKVSGELRSGSAQFNTYPHVEKLEFLDGPKFLKQGLKSQFQLKLTQQDGSPLLPEPGKQITVKTSETTGRTSLENQYTFPLPETGILTFEHETAATTTNLRLEAEYNGVIARENLYQIFKSFNNNSISVERTSPEGGPNGEIVFTVRATEDINKIFYQIISKKAVAQSGQLNVNPPGKLTTFRVLSADSMAPSSTVLVYYLTASGEIIAASDRFNVQFNLQNQMAMTWDQDTRRVGETATLSVSASANSYVSVGAVDQSVLLLGESNDITTDRVISELESYDKKDNSGGCCGPRPVPFGPVRGKRSFFWRPFYTASDTAKVIEASGLVFMTDATVYEAPSFDDDHVLFDLVPQEAGIMMFKGNTGATGQSDTETPAVYVRSLFPESWFWDSQTAGPSGLASFNVLVPDTITTWVATAFALHPQTGLGIPPQRANLTAFIPFFIRANTPYSVIRGEEITINVNVFNYLNSATTATIELQSSTEFKVKKDKNDVAASKALTRSVQVMATKGASVEFIIIPEVLGTITLKLRATASGQAAADALDKPLLVEPEGRLVETNKPFFFDLSTSGGSFSDQAAITFPAENVVAGSELITISMIGDILGTSLNGLERLVRMPYGCGEQNMVTFTPNIYVRRYFEATGSGNQDLKDQTTKFMISGYTRELTYQRDDGSFSAFGNSDESGSTWLTAFVAQSFRQASAYVYVDDAVLVKALKWLIGNTFTFQTGEFREIGRVLHAEMQGGSLKTMTAYVLIALEQCRDLDTEVPGLLSAITGARENLEAAINTISDPYPLAIMAYALQLTGSQRVSEILGKLDAMAETRNSDEKYWKVESVEESGAESRGYRRRKPNNEVELASFVLLTYTLRGDTTAGLPIAKFLMSSKKPSGGFGSTQNTVWGLNALSEFAARTRSANQQVTVTLSYGGRSLGEYTINQQNSQVLQTQFVEPDVIQSGEAVNIQVSGSGSGLIEVSSRYHTTTEEKNPTLELKVNAKQRNPNVREITSCVRVLDPKAKDMILISVEDPTDFAADRSSIEVKKPIQRVEKNGKSIDIYLDEIPANQDQCVKMLSYRQADVQNARAPVAKAFSYYSGEETTVKVGTTTDTGGNGNGTGGCGHVEASFVLTLLLTLTVYWLRRN